MNVAESDRLLAADPNAGYSAHAGAQPQRIPVPSRCARCYQSIWMLDTRRLPPSASALRHHGAGKPAPSAGCGIGRDPSRRRVAAAVQRRRRWHPRAPNSCSLRVCDQPRPPRPRWAQRCSTLSAKVDDVRRITADDAEAGRGCWPVSTCLALPRPVNRLSGLADGDRTILRRFNLFRRNPTAGQRQPSKSSRLRR